MSKNDVKRIQTTLEVVTDNLDDLVNELAPGSRVAKKLVDQLYKTISDVCSEIDDELEIKANNQ
jgi:hypothetical protein